LTGAAITDSNLKPSLGKVGKPEAPQTRRPRQVISSRQAQKARAAGPRGNSGRLRNPLNWLCRSAFLWFFTEFWGRVFAPEGPNVNNSGCNPENHGDNSVGPRRGPTGGAGGQFNPSGVEDVCAAASPGCTGGYSRSIPPGLPRRPTACHRTAPVLEIREEPFLGTAIHAIRDGPRGFRIAKRPSGAGLSAE
jgi:hypothetical protein